MKGDAVADRGDPRATFRSRALFALRVTVLPPLLAGNIVLHATALLAIAPLKALPSTRMRAIVQAWLCGIAESWIGVNRFAWHRLTPTRLVVEEEGILRADGQYLVLANHCSGVDIIVLQHVFNRRIPLLRFFLKRQLFWVPVLGLAWWALDFPFMGRYSPKQVARNPALAGRDIAATRRACEKFRAMPVAMMNFVEGTRFTAARHAAQSSPYRHLLKPRTAGAAFVLNAMGPSLDALLDVSIAYPGRTPSLLDLLLGRVPEVRVRVRQRTVPAEWAAGDYQGDREFRVRFQRWMNDLWFEKDADLHALLAASPPRAAAATD